MYIDIVRERRRKLEYSYTTKAAAAANQFYQI